MSETPPEPPLGRPIYDESTTAPAGGGPADESSVGEGEHVVVIPHTAGSAGAAHTQQER